MNDIVEDWSKIELGAKAVLLLGNGASRAIDNDAFDYTSLLSRAKLSKASREVFELIGDSDFEKALLRLEITKETNKAVGLEESKTQAYINEIREGLVFAVQSIHPPQRIALDIGKATNAISFMSNFKSVFTLNYDFFLYWLINMSKNVSEPTRYFKDGFWNNRKFCHGQTELLGKMKDGLPATVCYFLHGALHLIDEPEEKLIIDEQDDQLNVRLLRKVKEAWQRGNRPLFVSEGKAEIKLRRIESSKYLRHAFEEFKRLIKGNDVVIHGASLSQQDQHLLDVINISKPNRVFVSIHEPSHAKRSELNEWYRKIHTESLHFYDAKSKGSWIH